MSEIKSRLSDIVTLVIIFFSILFYYISSVLVVRSLIYSSSALLMPFVIFFIIIVPLFIVLFVGVKSVVDSISGKAAANLRIKITGIMSVVFIISIVIIADIYYRVSHAETEEPVPVTGYREISEIIGETLRLGGDKGEWKVSDLMDYVFSLTGVIYIEISDRSGRILGGMYKEPGVSKVPVQGEFYREEIRIIESTGFRINNSGTFGSIIDLEYRGLLVRHDSIYYVTVGFEPVGYVRKAKTDSKEDTLFTMYFYMITLTMIYLFAVIAVYYMAREFNNAIEYFNAAMENVFRDNPSGLHITSEIKDLRSSVLSFNAVLKEFRVIRRNDSIKQRKQVWDEVCKRISHELKNPLTPIRLSSERLLLKYGKDDFEHVMQKSVQVILNQVETIEKKINDFADFADLPSLNMFEGGVIEPLNKSADKVRKTYPGLLVSLINKSADHVIMRDPYSLEFVFTNMVEICVKEMEAEDDVIIDVQDYSDDGEYVLITVQNSKCELKYDKLVSGYYENRFSAYNYVIVSMRKIIDDHHGVFTITGDMHGVMMSVTIPVT